MSASYLLTAYNSKEYYPSGNYANEFAAVSISAAQDYTSDPILMLMTTERTTSLIFDCLEKAMYIVPHESKAKLNRAVLKVSFCTNSVLLIESPTESSFPIQIGLP